MKTSLKFLSFFFAAALPSTLAAEFAGLPLPAGFGSLSAFAGFAVVLVLLTVSADYSRSRRTLTSKVPAVASVKAAHPLAA